MTLSLVVTLLLLFKLCKAFENIPNQKIIVTLLLFCLHTERSSVFESQIIALFYVSYWSYSNFSIYALKPCRATPIRGGFRDFENEGSALCRSATMVGRRRKCFRWSKKAEITLETVSFSQIIYISIFNFSIFIDKILLILQNLLTLW